MEKATPPGANRRTMGSSDRVLRSITREVAQPVATTANYLLPNPTLMGLATETMFFIAGYVDEGDLWALCLVNHRCNSIATPLLWKAMYANPKRCKEILLWAVENGDHGLLQKLLEKPHEVSPNFLYPSSMLRSRLKDVLAAQGLRGALSPREDRAFEAEVFREKYCRSALIRNNVRRQRAYANLHHAMTDNDLDWNLTNVDYPHTCSLRVFDIDRILGGTEDRQYWAWAPIHVAILRGDNPALRMLLDHGADVNAQCSGLCDCAVPDLTGATEHNFSVAPHRDRSVWTPLHIAMCTGNQDAARLLIARGASALVGSLIRQSYGVDRKSRLSMNAFQNAAWIGSVPMCQILLATPHFRQYLDRCNLKLQTALHYAAAGGNIRTVGKLLLENGATFYFYEGETPRLGPAVQRIRNDPLRLLCMHSKYDDARWLIHFCHDLYQGQGRNPRPLYTRALAAVCHLRRPTVYNRLSLRAQQDQLYSLTAQDINEIPKVDWQEVTRSRSHRVTLAITLLSFGADPNNTQEVPDCYRRTVHRTPLQLAASSKFIEMVRVLLLHGADCHKIGVRYENDRKLPKDLPLMLAVSAAVSGGGDNLDTVRLLMNGTSLNDIGEHSILSMLQSLVWDRKGGYCNFTTKNPVWFSTVKMFLCRGAAAATSQSNWESIIQDACIPTNLEYCKLLENWRPIRHFPEHTLIAMLKNALFGYKHEDQLATPEDLGLVKWVLGHCRTSGGFLTVSIRNQLLDLAETAARGGREVTAIAVEDFVWDTPCPDATPCPQGSAHPQHAASSTGLGIPQGTAGSQSASKL